MCDIKVMKKIESSNDMVNHPENFNLLKVIVDYLSLLRGQSVDLLVIAQSY